jgi:hypothetical protein
MAIPTSNLRIAQIANALYGAVVGSVTNNAVVADILQAGFNATVNTYYTYSFGTMPAATVAANMAANLGITTASVGAANVTAATSYIVAQLNAAPGAQGVAVSNILALWSGMTADPTFGVAATAWNAAIANAMTYTASGATADQSLGNSTGGSTYQLTTGVEAMLGTAGADTFNAYILNNANTLQSGDVINGGAGTDTLFADMGSSQSFAVTPHTSNIENVTIRAQSDAIDTAQNNTQNQNVNIDAQRMSGVAKWESNGSRADLIIEDVRINSNISTIAFVESDPGNVDMAVYFNERNLVNTTSGTSSLNLQIMDTVSAAAGTAPLLNSTYGSFTFTATTGGVATVITLASQAIQDAQTYAAMVTAFQAALDATLGAGAATATVGSNFSVVDPASGTTVTGQSIVLTTTGTVIFTTPAGSGWASSGVAPAASNFYTNFSQGTSSTTALVSTSIILDDVGMGDTGGDLVVGGMSTGLTSNDSGVQRFNIEVRDNSKLQTINSTNNTLREVVITNGVTSSSSSAYVTTTANAGNLTVNGTNFGTSTAISVVDTALRGTEAIVGSAQTISHSIAGSAGFTDVRLIDASAMTGKFAFTAAITVDSIAKYITLVDTAANPGADVATANTTDLGANFIYTGGTKADTMVVTMDGTVVSSRSTVVSGQSDFTFNISGGAGNDAITTTIIPGAIKGNAQAWYNNQKLNANITINGGDGNDTIRTPGAGDVIINADAGDDTIYTDNTGTLATANATGSAGTAATAYTNAAAAELATALAARVASNSSGWVHGDGTAIGASITTAAVVAGLATLDQITPTNPPALPVITHAALAAGTTAAAAGGFITLAQKVALDTAYNSATGGVVTPAVGIGAAATLAGQVAVAGNVTAPELAAGDALLATYVAAAKAADAAAVVADSNVAVQNALLNATQLAVVVATLAVNGVEDPTTGGVELGTATKVANLNTLHSALVSGATQAQAVAAIDVATLNGTLTGGEPAALLVAVGAGAMDAADAAAVTAILSVTKNTAALANTVAQATLTAALAADATAVNTAAGIVALDPAAAAGSAVANDFVGSNEAATAAATALSNSTKAAVDVVDAQAINTALAGLKTAVNVGSLDADVNNAIANASAAITAAIADSAANGTNALAGLNPFPGVTAALLLLAGVPSAAVDAAEELAFDTGALGVFNANSIDSLVITNTAVVDRLTIVAANAAASATAHATAAAIALAATNSGASSLTIAAPKAVYVFDTSNQTAAYNRVTMDDRNLADLKSDANHQYNFFNSTVKVTYKGIDSTAVVVAGTGSKTSDLEINQAIKSAINSDAVLSKLLLATDGPANSLVVTSLIDGTHTTANLAVTLTLPTTAGAGVAAAAAVYGVAANDAAVLAVMATAKTSFDTKGDYVTQFAESGAAGGNTVLVGGNSLSSSDNTVTGGTGNDVIVLGTTVGVQADKMDSSNEIVVYSAAFGNDTIVNFAATGLGVDQLNFSGLNGRGSAFGSLVTDKSIVVALETVANDTAAEIAALFTDSATAINHVYIAYNANNIASVYTVADAAGTTAGNVVATLVGTIDLADTGWATLTAANFV